MEVSIYLFKIPLKLFIDFIVTKTDAVKESDIESK
jgi:hypothetical protein